MRKTDFNRTFYTLIIWSGVQLLLIIVVVPETYHPVLLRRKAIRLRSETGDPRYVAPIEKVKASQSVASFITDTSTL